MGQHLKKNPQSTQDVSASQKEKNGNFQLFLECNKQNQIYSGVIRTPAHNVRS